MTDLKERIADLCHKQWSKWMMYLSRFGTFNKDGTFTIDADKVKRWKRQMETDYQNLSESEKDSDRKEAQLFIDALETGSK